MAASNVRVADVLALNVFNAVLDEFDDGNCDTSGEKRTELARLVDESINPAEKSIAKLGHKYLGDVALAAWDVLDDKSQKLTLQHVEKWLRKRGSDVWFVGTPNPNPDATYAMNRDFSAAKYTLHVIVRAPLDAMAEIVEMNGSYAANFARLADTGMMFLKQGANAFNNANKK